MAVQRSERACGWQGNYFATGTKDHMVSYFTYPAAEFQKRRRPLKVAAR